MRDVTDGEFDEVVLRAGRPVVVDFWAPWCGPCKAVTKVLEQLAEARPDVDFVKVDVDANLDTASRYGVLSLPTAVLFVDGEARETLIGARPRSHYERALAEVVPAG